MLKTRLFLLLLAARPLYAQTPYLVKDINTTVSLAPVGSAPTLFTACRNKIFFVATVSASGQELWSTDGTSGGTSMVSDILPGASNSSPGGLVCLNNTLLFSARDVDHGVEYWTSDGTASGTHMLLDASPGPNSSAPAPKILYKNQLLFVAEDGISGRELWATDGTASGTRLVKDISAGSASSSPSYFVTMGNSVYFAAANALWKTDGTSDGTVKVASVPARNLTVAGSQLFFEGATAAANWEPWVSDGTESGTRMIVDLRPGPAAAFDTKFSFSGSAALGNRVLFVADDGVHGRELWISDGTAAGTHILRELKPGASGPWDNGLTFSAALLGDRLFFTGWDAEHGYEAWSTDGTEEGTSLFYDAVAGTTSSTPYFARSGDKLFFVVTLPTGSLALFVTDGSAGGTHAIAPSSGAAPFISAGSLWAVDGKVYFAASTPLAGAEPWVTDGTESGTRMIANIAADAAPSSAPSRLTVAGNLLFFFATSPREPGSAGPALWRSDGTEAGTFKLMDVDRTDGDVLVVGSELLFSASPPLSFDRHWYLSDGTVEGTGTKRADDFLNRFGPSPRSSLLSFHDVLFAHIEDLTVHDTSLWAATAPASVVRLGGRNPSRTADYGDRFVFFSKALVERFQYSLGYTGLWTTDLTAAGTYPLIPDLDDYDQIYGPASAGGTLYFVKQLHNENPKLWKSDGTVGGTSMVKELPVSFIGAYGVTMFGAGRRLFFTVNSDLWTSDGTAAGTIQLSDLVQPDFSTAVPMYAVGDRFVFRRSNGNSYELWGSDGTIAGTKLLAKLPTVYDVQFARGIGATLLFPSFDAAHGNEIWITDGTPEGTKLFIDLNAGARGSDPSSFVRIGNTVYFTALNDVVGDELWALPLTEPSLSIADAHVTEGAGGAIAHVAVSLAAAAGQAVSVDYSTSDGSAHAGDDYVSTSGTLTFAAGETKKTIDVPIRGDDAGEGNEAFFVTLRNAHGGAIARAEATVVIDDDDRSADLNVVPQFNSSLEDSALVGNDGPQAASEIRLNFSSTPAIDRYPTYCGICAIPQLAAGATDSGGRSTQFLPTQTYFGVTVSAREHDPRPSNDTATWTISKNRAIVMTPGVLSTGGTATVTIKDSLFVTEDLISSDPSVVTVSALTQSADGHLWSATVAGVKPGTVMLTSKVSGEPLRVDVFAAGSRPRWPGALGVGALSTTTNFDRPIELDIAPSGRSPSNGAVPTGTVTVSLALGGVTHYTLDGTTLRIPLYLPVLGANTATITYSGDGEFLPQTFQQILYVNKGKATITAVLEPVSGAAGTFTLALGLDGSPVAAPSGVVTVMNGATEVARLTLVAGANGESSARTTLTNLAASPTLTLNYSGDAFYESATQQVRAITPRHRGARH